MPHTRNPLPRAANVIDALERADPAARPYLMWMLDDRGVVHVHPVADLTVAAETAHVWAAEWGGRVHFLEDPHGQIVPQSQWAQTARTDDPAVTHVFTVELRAPDAIALGAVSALWSTTDLAAAHRWRDQLPAHLRSRSLIVSNAPTRPPAPEHRPPGL